MRIAKHLGRNIHGYNSGKRFSARSRSSMGAQSHFSGHPAQAPPQAWPTILTPLEAVKFVAGVGFLTLSKEWITYHGRNMYEDWKAEKNMRKMVEELDRKKKESQEAYLEMIAREIGTLKPKLSKREVADWEVNSYEREVAVLNSKVYAWTQGEDTAPQEGHPSTQSG